MVDAIKVGRDALDRMMPFENGSALNLVGMINVADSMAAVKKLVFEEKRITKKELKAALDANWRGNGYEEVRKMCRAAPKYGNNINYVDSIAKELYRFLIDEEAKYRTFGRPEHGKIRGIGGASISSMFAGGTIVGATPDGRYAGTTLADGTASPAQGRDTHGPTAMLRSAAKIDQSACASTLLNVKLHPSSLPSRWWSSREQLS
jgi:formate C-acetyltransferase